MFESLEGGRYGLHAVRGGGINGRLNSISGFSGLSLDAGRGGGIRHRNGVSVSGSASFLALSVHHCFFVLLFVFVSFYLFYL